MKLTNEAIEAIENQCGYFDPSNQNIFKDGAINALTNPEIYEKAGLVRKEDAQTLGLENWAEGVKNGLNSAGLISFEDAMGFADDLKEAAKSIIERMTDQYKARNGRMCYIEDEHGDKMYIVPFDDIERLRDLIETKKNNIETVGSIITSAMKLHELNTDIVEKKIGLAKGTLDKIMKDEFYTNSIPALLFKNILLSLNISFEKINTVLIPTFELVKSKETEESISKKDIHYGLWENKEALLNYAEKLKGLMTN